MVFGNYPSLIEKLALRYLFAEYMKEVPKVVGEVIRKFPYGNPAYKSNRFPLMPS
jgi:hypothetical protein